jgi:hypothetical protein
MSRYTVICHRCGKSTFVDLSKTVSDQRCRACRGFLQGVDVSIGDKPKTLKRKTKWKVTGAAAQETEWRDQDNPVIPVRQRWPRFYRWTIAGGLVVFLAAIGWINYLKFRDSIGGHREVFGQKEPTKPDIRVSPEWRKEATDTARKALAARTADELLPFLFHPDASDDAIRRYYAEQENLPLGKDLVKEFIIPTGAYAENVVTFQYFDFTGRMRALALVEKENPHAMKIDWGSLTGVGEMSLQEYAKTTPSRGVVIRARARAGEYYNGPFADSSKWLSVRLSSVTDDDVIYGYVDRAFTLAADMEALVPSNPGGEALFDQPVVLILKYPEKDVKREQTRIVALLSDTWYQPRGLQEFIDTARTLDKDARAEKPKNSPADKEDHKPEKPAAPVPPPGGPQP